MQQLTPSGDGAASLAQLQRLEEIVSRQSIQIATLEREAEFFHKGLGDAIDQQVEEASKRRGMQGSDYINLSKFIARHMGFAVADFKRTIDELVQSSIPVKTIQTLEKRLLARPTATDDMATVLSRIASMESYMYTHHAPTHSPSFTHASHTVPSADPVAPQELETLKAHVQQLESTLMKEVQKAYATVYNPKEMGGPLARLQSQVDIVQQDIQSLKRVDGQAIAEALITNSAAMLRHEFQDYMATRASSAELAAFQTDIRRVEEFSRDVQTGFYAMRSAYRPLFDTMKQQFSEDRWKSLEMQLKTKVDQAIEESIRRSNISLDFQSTKIHSFTETAQQRLDAVSAEIRSQYGPEMVQMHIQRIQTALETQQTAWFAGIESHISKRIVGMEKEIQQQSFQIQQFMEKTSADIEATSLKAKYAEFETQLEIQRNQISSWKQKLEDQTKQHVAALESLEIQRTAVNIDLKAAASDVQTIRQSIYDTKLELKKELDSWLQDRNGQIQRKFTDAAAEIQQIKDAFLLLKANLIQEIEEHKQREKYSEFQKTLETRLQTWTQSQTEYFQRRIIDFGKDIQQHIQTLDSREAEFNTLFSEDTMRGFVEEVQRRLRSSQDDWMRRRTEEYESRYSEMKRDSTTRVQDIQTLYTQVQSAIAENRQKQAKESDALRTLSQDLLVQTKEQLALQKQDALQVHRDMRVTAIQIADQLKQQYDQDSTALKRKETDIEQIRQVSEEFVSKTSLMLVKQKAEALQLKQQQEQEIAAVKRKEKSLEYLNQLSDDFLTKTSKDILKQKEAVQNLQSFAQEAINASIQDLKVQHETELASLKRSEQVAETKLVQTLSQLNMLNQRIQTAIQRTEALESKLSHVDIIQTRKQVTIQENMHPMQEKYNGMSRCFYTAIFAAPNQEADTLAAIKAPLQGWDYICFTNLSLPSTLGWKIIQKPLTEDPRLAAKRVKWQSHTVLQDYDIAIWVDAYLAPNVHYENLLQRWLLQMMERQALIGHRNHKERDCVYDECDAVLRFKRDTTQHVEALRQQLMNANVPEHNGLYDTNIVVRFHKYKEVQELSNAVMHILETVTIRDQLAIPLLYATRQFDSIYTQEFMKAFSKDGRHVRIAV